MPYEGYIEVKAFSQEGQVMACVVQIVRLLNDVPGLCIRGDRFYNEWNERNTMDQVGEHIVRLPLSIMSL